jgi:Rrf2 family protein
MAQGHSLGSKTGLYGASVEYGLHSLLWLIEPREPPLSSRNLAEFQGISASLLAKVMPKLEKAGLVASSGGINGGYRLARGADEITVLDVVTAIDRDKRLFDCKEIRAGCVLFNGHLPEWSAGRTCTIHAVMLRAENSMRKELARTTLLDLVNAVGFPKEFGEDAARWFGERTAAREASRVAAVKTGRRRPAKT